MTFSILTPSIRPKGLAITQSSLKEQTLQDFEWLVELGIPDRGHDLNASYNRMLRRAKGEIIISLQDYIRIPKDGLERFYKAHKQNPDTFFTAPVGKVLDWKDKPEFDWREHTNECDWRRWEIDWGSAPLKALKKIGGFDEELDGHWSSDNVNVAFRADLAGYQFKCLSDNKAIAIDHDKKMKHPFRDDYDPDFNNTRLALFEKGFKVDYLN